MFTTEKIYEIVGTFLVNSTVYNNKNVSSTFRVVAKDEFIFRILVLPAFAILESVCECKTKDPYKYFPAPVPSNGHNKLKPDHSNTKESRYSKHRNITTKFL